MTPLCDTFDEQLAAECGAARPWSASLEAHLAECPACAAAARRRVAGLEVLRSLPSEAAPDALDGLVVAALEAGHREDRAVEELRGVAGPGAPAELEGRLDELLAELRSEGLFGQPVAPEELAPRVDRDLQDLPAAIVSRQLDRLPQVPAPAGLQQRVDGDLGSPRPARRLTLVRGIAAGLAAAAAAALLFTAVRSLSVPELPAPRSLALEFRVERPSDLDALSPDARHLYERLTGGLAPALTEAGREDLGGPAVLGAPRGAGGAGRTATGGSTTSPSGPGARGGTQNLGSSAGGGATTRAGGQSATLGGHTAPACFERLPVAPFETHFRGDRVVTLRAEDSSGQPYQLEYLEEVAADGAGAFTVVPVQVLAPVMTFGEASDFLQRQASREGFFYRYRDFRIHDWARFQLHYEVQDLGLADSVAGVSCKVFEVRRRDGSGPLRRVSVDPQTSLVLAEEVLGVGGELLRRTRFQTFQLGADLSDLQLGGLAGGWTTTDLAGLEQQLGGDALVPDALPPGHGLQSASWRSGQGLPTAQADWAQLVFDDGVESVFFLYEDGVTASGNTPGQFPVGQDGDLVRVYTFADWTLVEGSVRGRRVMAVGRVHEQELLLLVQSALE